MRIVAVSVGFGCVDLDKNLNCEHGKVCVGVSASQAMYFIIGC